jgi:hypothetical protein
LIETNKPQMTRPLGSSPTASSRRLTATTGQSAGAPRNGTQSLPVSAGWDSPYRHLPAAVSCTPSHVPHRSSRPDSRRLHAGHRLANKRAPARLFPEPFDCPGFDAIRTNFDTSQAVTQRLSDPHLTPHGRLSPHRSPRQSSANAAVGGLKPPPAGRLRRANLHLRWNTASRSSPTSSHLRARGTLEHLFEYCETAAALSSRD